MGLVFFSGRFFCSVRMQFCVQSQCNWVFRSNAIRCACQRNYAGSQTLLLIGSLPADSQGLLAGMSGSAHFAEAQ